MPALRRVPVAVGAAPERNRDIQEFGWTAAKICRRASPSRGGLVSETNLNGGVRCTPRRRRSLQADVELQAVPQVGQANTAAGSRCKDVGCRRRFGAKKVT